MRAARALHDGVETLFLRRLHHPQAGLAVAVAQHDQLAHDVGVRQHDGPPLLDGLDLFFGAHLECRLITPIGREIEDVAVQVRRHLLRTVGTSPPHLRQFTRAVEVACIVFELFPQGPGIERSGLFPFFDAAQRPGSFGEVKRPRRADLGQNHVTITLP